MLMSYVSFVAVRSSHICEMIGQFYEAQAQGRGPIIGHFDPDLMRTYEKLRPPSYLSLG